MINLKGAGRCDWDTRDCPFELYLQCHTQISGLDNSSHVLLAVGLALAIPIAITLYSLVDTLIVTTLLSQLKRHGRIYLVHGWIYVISIHAFHYLLCWLTDSWLDLTCSNHAHLCTLGFKEGAACKNTTRKYCLFSTWSVVLVTPNSVMDRGEK